jgi:peptidyl-tRNA hydrolase, PTH1 family
MLLIIGLGNHGEKHVRHRHNVGFMAVEAIHRRHGFGPWRRRFQGEVAEGNLAGEKCLLIKPQTYMNRSGQSVGEAANFFKLAPNQVLVIHDEVDLPPGKIRMKAGGGGAGHNGLRSVGSAIGNEFRRLRIGVGHPGARERVAGYVLHDFSKADGAWLEPLLDAIADNAPLLAEDKDSTFANRLHEALAPLNSEEKNSKSVNKSSKKPESDRDSARPPQSSDIQSEPRHEGALARGLRKLFGG